jgi:hypothetical protein
VESAIRYGTSHLYRAVLFCQHSYNVDVERKAFGDPVFSTRMDSRLAHRVMSGSGMILYNRKTIKAGQGQVTRVIFLSSYSIVSG